MYDRVKKVIIEVLCVNGEEIHYESHFEKDLGADSVDTISLVMALEDEFQGNISDKDIQQITTVKDTVEFLSRQLIQKQGYS
ncbi:MAG: acyl carrier protein [Deltaproteobacteria bacterium]|nr:acyl carrier protein [Deltaproteobacteria bacterium]